MRDVGGTRSSGMVQWKKEGDGVDRGIRDYFSPQVWGDGTGPMLSHVPTPQLGRYRVPAGGWQCHKYLCAGGWAPTTASPPWGRGSPSAGTSPCDGYRGDTGGDEHALGGESPQPGFGGSGLTCRVLGRAGAHCRGPVCPGPCTPCHPRPAGRAGSVPSTNTRPPPSPASCRSGQWAAACTGARHPGTGGF